MHTPNDRIQVPLSILTDSERFVVGMIVEEAKRRVKERVTAWDPMARNFDVLRSSPYLLTEREVDIAKLVFEGGSYKEIARTLGISHRTVETHSVRARDKIGARTKTEMVRMIADLL